MTESTMPSKEDEYLTSFDPLLNTNEVIGASHFLSDKCPVAHSDRDGGFWLLNRYDDVFNALRDPDTFASGAFIPARPVELLHMPPIDSNAPEHRPFRKLLNPSMTPQAVAGYEPGIRRLIGELIDGFVADGKCDITDRLAKQFPARVTFRELFSIDDQAEIAQLQTWTCTLSYGMYRETPELLGEYQQAWTQWNREFIVRRRHQPRRNDLVDALLYGQVLGADLTVGEILGVLQVLTFGGLITTADATGNCIILIASTPGLEDRLREDRSLIASVIEEALRLDPPITSAVRRCTRDIAVGGKTLHEGERVLLNFIAANRDGTKFDDPDKFNVDKPSNRHLAFSGGAHRCIGSHLARASLHIAIEELLARVKNIQLDGEPQRASLQSSLWRVLEALPVTFTPMS
jgi:cytochrome P450